MIVDPTSLNLSKDDKELRESNPQFINRKHKLSFKKIYKDYDFIEDYIKKIDTDIPLTRIPEKLVKSRFLRKKYLPKNNYKNIIKNIKKDKIEDKRYGKSATGMVNHPFFRVKPYKNKSIYVREYIKAIDSEIPIPNTYCSPTYLLADDTLRAVHSKDGFDGFIEKDSLEYLIPPYKRINDKIIFRKDDGKYTFPLAIPSDKGLRRDVMYKYVRDTSVNIMQSDPLLKGELNNTNIITYSLPYNNHSLDKEINEFCEDKRLNYKVLKRDTIVNMIKNDYGQHRFILKSQTGKLSGILIWTDMGDYIYIDTCVGFSDCPPFDHTRMPSVEEHKIYLYHPEAITIGRFMECFPNGTVFYTHGSGLILRERYYKQYCQPFQIFEIRTYYNVPVRIDSRGVRTPTGSIPGEYFDSTHKKIGEGKIYNIMLLAPLLHTPLNKIKDEVIREKIRSFKNKRTHKFLLNRNIMNKYLESKRKELN